MRAILCCSFVCRHICELPFLLNPLHKSIKIAGFYTVYLLCACLTERFEPYAWHRLKPTVGRFAAQWELFQGLMFKTPYLNLAYFPLQCHYLRTVFFLKKIFMLNYCHYNIHMIKFIYAGNPANRRQYDFPAACQCVCGMYAIFTRLVSVEENKR